MSSLSSNPLSNSNNDGHGDQSTHNTLRKDPVSRQTPSSSKLIKSRTGAADNDASLDPAANSQQQQGPISRTNRLRKALGVGSSNVGVDSSQNHSDSKHAGPSNPGSRKPSGARASPSNSPTLLKNQLPSAQEPTQTPSPRPSALRSQSYSKRHASFDTPREVPMPPMPTGTSSIDPIALDDSDMERNHAAAASWKYASRQPQSGSRHAETSRRPMEQSTSFRRASAAVPPSADILTRDGMHIDLSNEAYSQPPQICRNNSAPTPPHTPSAERMDLRYPQPNDADSGNSSERDGSGSEQTSPTPNSAGAEVPERGYLGQQRDGVKGAQNGPQSSAEALFREGRLSTASLPLPRSYGAERVSRLPPPARPTPQGGNASGSGSGSDGGQQAKTPTNLPRRPNTNLERLDSSKTFTDDSLNPGSAVTYRTSYPFTGMFARDVPLVPGHRGSSLVADVEKNAQAGTAWRSSSPFMRRDYSEEDSEAKSAISSGQIPKLPEIEAPSAPLHPFLETSTFTTPSSSARAFNFGPSSTTATPGHEKTSPGTISVDRPTLSNISSAEGDAKSSPAHSVDRTSTASGSSRAASDLAIFPENPNSEPKDLESSPAQSQGRNGKEPSRNDIIGSNRATNLSSRPRPTTEPTPMTSSSAIGGPTMTVDTTPSAYILEATLPGYQRDEITLSTRKKRILHVVADGFVSGGGHFERRVSFGYDADMSRVRAEFNGSTLKITVPRRPTPQTFAASLGTSATTGGGSSSGLGGSGMFWRGRSNVL